MRRPPVPKPKAAPRQELLTLLGDDELYQRQIARRIGKTERTVAYMLEAMETDGIVKSRFGPGYPRPVRLWRATGDPMPLTLTPAERRAEPRQTEARVPFNFAALLMVMK